MKKSITLLFVLMLALSLMLSACTQSSEKANEPTNPTDSNLPVSEEQTVPYEDWENAFPDAPWADLYKDDFVTGKKLSVDYTYRTTPANVKRTLEGNLYLQGWPIVKDTVTLKVLAPKNGLLSGDPEENFVIKNLEKKMNVHIEWTFVPADQYKERLNIILASGDLPDIIIGANLTPDQQMQYGEKEGLLIPLNPLIEKYGDWTKKALEIRPLVKQAITSPTGSIYALPQIYYNFHVRYAVKGWINKTWLDAVNLEVPTTIEEYEEALVAFKTQDPNGNKKADEIPLTGSPFGWNTSIMGFFMNPFVLNINNDHTFIEDGQVKFAPVTEEYKAGLKWLKGLYDQNLFDSSVFTMQSQQLSQLGLAEQQVVGSFPGAYFGAALGGSTTSEQSKDYVPMPPLRGPSGQAVTYYSPYDFAPGAFAITKSNEHPEVSLRWVDWFYSPEGLMANQYGREGEEWEYAAEGVQNLTQDRQAQWTQLVDVNQPNNVTLNFMGAPYANATEEQYIKIATVPGNDYNTKMTNWTKELYAGHEMEEFSPPATLGSVEDSNALSQMTPGIIAYINETSSKFVIGQMDIDKDWDHYVAQLDNMNLAKYLEIKQRQYDTFKAAK